jgi:hypothetical protein
LETDLTLDVACFSILVLIVDLESFNIDLGFFEEDLGFALARPSCFKVGTPGLGLGVDK